jgi:cytidine deaminase
MAARRVARRKAGMSDKPNERSRRRKPNVKELEPLVKDALAVRQHAYAPYSKFLVGAALLGASGKVYLGCNVENSSYGLCVCAERGAVARAVADGERHFRGIVVATQSVPPSPPCGMCRQTMCEFDADLPVLLVNDKGDRVETSLGELFPMSFTNDYL